MNLSDLRTPTLILDRRVLARNLATMSERARALGVDLRPHMKTAKCIEVARMATERHSGGVTVSTVAEAEYFVGHGLRDVTYAVAIAPEKLEAIARLQDQGTWVNVLADDLDVVHAIGREAESLGARFRLFIDIDSGYHRSGIEPESQALIEIGKAIEASPALELRGVLTHAGHAYNAKGIDAVAAVAEQERAETVKSAERLRAAGLPCPVVSVGSTPTAVCARSLAGVTEMRPGNYTFFDLDMAGRGVCSVDDVALSVLTTVIVHKTRHGHALIDAGGLALSKDVSAHEGTMPGVHYGLVADAAGGPPIDGLCVRSVSQEQGWLGTVDRDRPFPFDEFPIGRRLRVLPNHSCMTAAAYDRYNVVEGGEQIVAVWDRINGW